MKCAFSWAVVILAATIASGPTVAIDTAWRGPAPDLSSIRAKITARDFRSAIDELTPLLGTYQHAEIYSMLGFSYRKSGDFKQAAIYYDKALDADPDHRGALEYQGEMFVELGQFDKAKVNLEKLAIICPYGCEAREDLQNAIQAAVKAAKNN